MIACRQKTNENLWSSLQSKANQKRMRHPELQKDTKNIAKAFSKWTFAVKSL